MKLMGLTSLLAVVSVVGNLSFFRAHLRAAEKTKETPITMRLDFIVGGNHAPWFVALEKGFYAKRGVECHHPARHGFGGYDPHHCCGRC